MADEKKEAKAHSFELADGSGRVVTIIENPSTQTFQVTLRHGRKRIFTTHISTETNKQHE